MISSTATNTFCTMVFIIQIAAIAPMANTVAATRATFFASSRLSPSTAAP